MIYACCGGTWRWPGPRPFGIVYIGSVTREESAELYEHFLAKLCRQANCRHFFFCRQMWTAYRQMLTGCKKVKRCCKLSSACRPSLAKKCSSSSADSSLVTDHIYTVPNGLGPGQRQVPPQQAYIMSWALPLLFYKRHRLQLFNGQC